MTKPDTLALLVNRRLFRIVLIAWALAAALMILALLAYYRTDRAYTSALRQAEQLETATLELYNQILSEVLNTRSFLLTGDQAALTRRGLAHDNVTRQLEEISELQSGAPLDALPAILDLHNKYDLVAEQMIDMRRSGQQQQMLETFFAQSDPLVSAVQSASRALQGEVLDRLAQSSNRYSRDADLIIITIAMLFLIATTLVSILLMRDISPSLRALDFVETALISAAARQVYHPIEPPDGTPAAARVVDAFNQLASRLTSSTTTILKYVSFLHHEINSLLASVVGYGYMLADEQMRPDDFDPTEYGRVIVQQTRRVTQLVEDFTLAAKIEGNQFSPALMPVRLGPLLKMIAQEMEEDCAQEGRICRIEVRGAELPVVILGDALSLESALRKLIDNAIKYSPAGALVQLGLEWDRTASAAVAHATGGAPSTTVAPATTVAAVAPHRPLPTSVHIHVRDQGVGIAAEDLSGLFRPFYRIKNDATRRIPGNGMGLFLASAILRVHRGSISVQSAPGEGSCFTITLPLEK